MNKSWAENLKLQSLSRSNAKSSTGSEENDQAASFDEATSSESIPAPPNDDPTLVAGELNRWCVKGQWQIYRDAKMVNDKQKMARLITEERRVLIRSLHTVPDIHRLFNLHKCDRMARDTGMYSEEIVREFYVSYAATLQGSISKRWKPLAQDPLTSTLVRGFPVDISPATIRRFLYGPTASHSWALNTAEFDYRWDIVKSGAFQRNAEQREAVILWLSRVLPTKADNQVMWDRAVMVAALDSECRPHRGQLVHPTGALDIGLIRDEENRARGDLAHHTPTSSPSSSSQAASMGPSSFRSIPQLGAASIAEFEARMERKMEGMMDRKVQAANIASLWSDVEAILATPSVKPQVAPTALADDTVLDALFSGT
ncbi:hypothetical protein H5410_046844, partial [Solanum commersonii]